jgi:heptosyltransferase-2
MPRTIRHSTTEVIPAPRIAVLQPLPGIGDMIWHLPHIRAIAQHVGMPVTLIAKPRSAADQLFAGEPAMAAGVPTRFGYGFGMQRRFLNRPPYLPSAALPLHPHEQATAWLTAANIALADTEPSLPIVPAARTEVRRRLGSQADTYVAIGIGSSEQYKQWGAERFVRSGRRRLVVAHSGRRRG